jgi:multimeric flavodoxin WrbA
MQFLCIYGSPRINGNTDILLNKVVEGIELAGTGHNRIEKVYVRSMKIHPCTECRTCDKTGVCIIKDDIQELHDKICVSDYIIVSSPIFYYNVPAQLKIVIDRSQCYWARKYLLKKPAEKTGKKGVFLSTCASTPAHFFDCAKKTIKYYFDAYDIEYYKDLFINKTDNYGEILNKKEDLDKAVDLGRNLEPI